MAGTVKVDTQSFGTEVLEADGLVLVDFWAPWCGPCRIIGPVLEELAGEYADKVKITKLNVDDNQQLAGQFNVMSIPTLLFFKNGQVVEQMPGAVPKERLVAAIDKLQG